MKIVIDVHDTDSARDAAVKLIKATEDAPVSFDINGHLLLDRWLGDRWSFIVEPLEGL